jgi:hypothetical protein
MLPSTSSPPARSAGLALGSLAVWISGFLICFLIRLFSTFSRGETGLIELGALYYFWCIVIACSSFISLVISVIALRSNPRHPFTWIPLTLATVTLLAALEQLAPFGR